MLRDINNRTFLISQKTYEGLIADRARLDDLKKIRLKSEVSERREDVAKMQTELDRQRGLLNSQAAIMASDTFVITSLRKTVDNLGRDLKDSEEQRCKMQAELDRRQDLLNSQGATISRLRKIVDNLTLGLEVSRDDVDSIISDLNRSQDATDALALQLVDSQKDLEVSQEELRISRETANSLARQTCCFKTCPKKETR